MVQSSDGTAAAEPEPWAVKKYTFYSNNVIVVFLHTVYKPSLSKGTSNDWNYSLISQFFIYIIIVLLYCIFFAVCFCQLTTIHSCCPEKLHPKSDTTGWLLNYDRNS